MAEITKLLLKRISALNTVFARFLLCAAVLCAAKAGAEDGNPPEAVEKITGGEMIKRVGGKALADAFGWGDMLIVPSKLEARANRTANLYVQNRFNTTRDFRVVYAPDGEEARPDVRYGPRQFSLQPGQVQIVRILARAPENNAPFRVRLNVQMLPMVQPQQTGKLGGEKLSVRLSGVYGISVPVDISP